MKDRRPDREKPSSNERPTKRMAAIWLLMETEYDCVTENPVKVETFGLVDVPNRGIMRFCVPEVVPR